MITFLRRVWPLTLRVSGALVLAVVSFIVAHEAGLVELIYFAVLLVAVLVMSLLSLWLTRRVESITRSLTPDVATVDHESVVTVRVGMRSALPTSPGGWDDTVPSGIDGRARGVFPALGSGLRRGQRTVDLRYTVVGRVRGIHRLGPFGLTTTDPFGLARRRVRIGGQTRVTVAPRVVILPAIPGTAGEAGGMLQTLSAQPGQGADNLVARPYAPGDSMRRIHWRATAHRDTLMVRQEEQEASPTATVMLDRGSVHWGPDAVRPGGDPGFETAVSAAVSAVARLVHDGYTVEVIDTDGTPLADAIQGGDTHEVDDLAAEFATLTARAGDGLGRTAGMFAGTQAGPIIVVTGRLRMDDAEALSPLVHHTTLAVVLAAAPSADALARLRHRGWHAAAMPPGVDLVEAWLAAIEGSVTRVDA